MEPVEFQKNRNFGVFLDRYWNLEFPKISKILTVIGTTICSDFSVFWPKKPKIKKWDFGASKKIVNRNSESKNDRKSENGSSLIFDDKNIFYSTQ